MTKYEIYDYDIDVWGTRVGEYSVNDVIPTGLFVYADDSKSSIYKILGIDTTYSDQDKLEVCLNGYTGIIYVYYNRVPLFELHEVK